MVHGWPGCFYEFYKIIPLLTDPKNHGLSDEHVFEVICPSIPGYGFSEASSKKGMRLPEAVCPPPPQCQGPRLPPPGSLPGGRQVVSWASLLSRLRRRLRKEDTGPNRGKRSKGGNFIVKGPAPLPRIRGDGGRDTGRVPALRAASGPGLSCPQELPTRGGSTSGPCTVPAPQAVSTHRHQGQPALAAHLTPPSVPRLAQAHRLLGTGHPVLGPQDSLSPP